MQIAQRPLRKGAKRFNPELVIVHSMAEYMELGDRDRTAWEQLKADGVSAHALIMPSGTVVRCREDEQGAYHARGYNSRALGVEFIVPGVHTLHTFYERIKEPYLTDAQYDAGVELVSGWCSLYALTNVLRHSEADPERKRDPGDGFPWQRFIEDVLTC